MIRVVIDTNILVSSLLASGSPKAVLNLAYNQVFAWCVSDAVLKEYETVLAYPRLNIDQSDRRRTMTEIRKISQIVRPTIELEEASDETDNRFLECAQAAKANYLVTGNLRHFPKVWKYTKVVSPKDFLRLWQFQKPPDKN